MGQGAGLGRGKGGHRGIGGLMRGEEGEETSLVERMEGVITLLNYRFRYNKYEIVLEQFRILIDLPDYNSSIQYSLILDYKSQR